MTNLICTSCIFLVSILYVVTVIVGDYFKVQILNQKKWWEVEVTFMILFRWILSACLSHLKDCIYRSV